MNSCTRVAPSEPFTCMATQSFTIVSHYNPPDESDNEDEPLSDGDLDELAEQEKIWRTGPLYKSRSSESEAFVSHRAAYPPRFVPALLSSDDYSLSALPTSSGPPNRSTKTDHSDTKLGSWYKGLLTTSFAPHDGEPENGTSEATETPSTSHQIPLTKSPSNLVPQTLSPSHPASSSTPQTTTKKRKVRPNDWFIQNSLPKSSFTLAPTTNSSSSSSITDILTRNPPPLPNSSAAPYVPPLRTKLGPGNRGYALLAQKGWREGEGLGSWRTVATSEESISEAGPSRLRASNSVPSVKVEDARVREIPQNKERREVIDLTVSEIIDLTVSDDGSDSAWESDEDSIMPSSSHLPHQSSIPSPIPPQPQQQPDDHGRTVLIAPLNTYLKADRLGIGATRGNNSKPSSNIDTRKDRGTRNSAASPPPRPKPKPFTDTSQAMYTVRDRHRIKREQEHRSQMLRQKGGKRGTKGFASVKKEEERRRKDLLAYMNS